MSMNEADTNPTDQATVPAVGQTIQVTFPHEPGHTRTATAVRSYDDDGAVDLLVTFDSADPDDEGHEWTLYPEEVTSGLVCWAPVEEAA